MQIFRGICAKVHSNTDKLKETFLEATSKCRISLLTLTFSFIFNSKARISHWEIHGTKTQHFFQFKLKPLDFCNNEKIGPLPVFGKPVYYLGSLPSWLPVLLSASDNSCWFFGTAVVGWQWPSAGSCSCLNQEGSWIVEARCHFDRFPHLSSKWVGQPIAETD